MRADADALSASSAMVRHPSEAYTIAAAPTRLSDLRELLKPGISVFVTVTAAAGYLLGTPTGIEPLPFAALLLGTALTAGGSGALNHLFERQYDAQMERTKERPLPTGRLSARFALAYGLAVAAVGFVLLFAFVNTLTGLLAVATSVGYLFVYTPLKRRTKWNTLVGAVPGALPALGGWAAATGTVSTGGLAVFAIIYLWQLPHFLSLAWMYREDYARGGYQMLPVVEPDGRSTSLHALTATLALLVAGAIPAALELAGLLYLFGMLALGIWFTLPAFSFFAEPSHTRARRLLLASIVYVPVFFALVVVDYFLR